MVRPNTWILSVKVALMSTGVLSMAVLFKMAIPVVMEFSVSKAPVIWSSFVSWLKPPYLYLIINGIIITIAASSCFYHHEDDASSSTTTDAKADFAGAESRDADYEFLAKARSDFVGAVVYQEEKRRVEVEEEEKEEYVMEEAPVVEEKSMAVAGGEDSAWTPPRRMDSSEMVTEYDLTTEKPLVSARFGHRKPVKATPEGGNRALRVSKSKRHETLENTWKAITEGRSMPLTRHLKKLETWENHGRQIVVPDVDSSTTAAMKKSETFRDRTNYQSPVRTSKSPAGKLRREPSLSQDELNRRVEAFIKKFNEEMRLQRQESLNQYKEMINRGV